jgi:hypothetical protein
MERLTSEDSGVNRIKEPAFEQIEWSEWYDLGANLGHFLILPRAVQA